MNSERAEASSNHNPKDTAADRSRRDRQPSREGHAQPGDVFVRRAGAFAKGLPARLDEQVRRNPYATLALACVAATTVGVVLSSRVMRAVLTATMTAAALDLVRAAVRSVRANVEAV